MFEGLKQWWAAFKAERRANKIHRLCNKFRRLNCGADDCYNSATCRKTDDIVIECNKYEGLRRGYKL